MACLLTTPSIAAPSKFKVAREELLIELAGIRRYTSLPSVEYLKTSQVNVFGNALRQKTAGLEFAISKKVFEYSGE